MYRDVVSRSDSLLYNNELVLLNEENIDESLDGVWYY